MTVISLTDTTLHYKTLSPQSFTLPMSLDSLTNLVKNDQSAIIIFARHYPNVPKHLWSVFK